MTNEIDNTGGEELEDTTVDKALINPPSHLLRAERDLLLFCMEDKSFRKRGGNLDWDKVEHIFANKADSEKIFMRDRKRLRSTSKKFMYGKVSMKLITQVLPYALPKILKPKSQINLIEIMKHVLLVKSQCWWPGTTSWRRVFQIRGLIREVIHNV